MTPGFLRIARRSALIGLLTVVLGWSSGVIVARQTVGAAKPQGTPVTTSTQGQTGAPAQGRTGPATGQFAGRGGPGGPSGGPGYTWWKDEAIKKEIGLRDDQVHRLDGLYERRAKAMASFVEEYNKQRDALEQMVKERIADDGAVALQISRMESPRIRLEESRILMEYQMSRVLDTVQNQKLQAYWERMRAERGRGRGAAHPAAR